MGGMSETERIYKSELLPRKGEYTAWALASASVLGLFFLKIAGIFYIWAIIFVGLLFFSAIAISLGNWMDRHTQIRLHTDGVSFTNGLRKVHFTWDEIERVLSFPARWGRKVYVIGAKAHFEFKTLGEVEYQGEIQGKTGFTEGAAIMAEIINASGLTVETVEGSQKAYTRPAQADGTPN